MSPKPANIYEAGVSLVSESARLRDFDLPTEVSLDAIGESKPGAIVLDIGAGSNASLGNVVRKNGGEYIAFDRNESFLRLQKSAGAKTIYGDARLAVLRSYEPKFDHVLSAAPAAQKPDLHTLVDASRSAIRQKSIDSIASDDVLSAGANLDNFCLIKQKILARR